MEIKAKLKHLRIAPRKARLLADLIRGSEVNKAIDQLRFANKKSAPLMIKLINSAVANAVHNYDLNKNNLYIKEIRVEDGKILKRWLPRAHGRATVLRKRMCHLYIVLGEIVASGKKEAKKVETEDPVKLEDLSQKPKNKEKSKDDKKEKKDKDFKSRESSSGRGFSGKLFQRKTG